MPNLRLITLGTGGMIPSLDRSLPSTAMKRGGEVILFDCGEGTQVQVMKAGIGFGGIEKIFISHLHGDHITGLPGFLMTLSQTNRQKSLYIFGPPGIKGFWRALGRTLGFKTGYEVVIQEIEGDFQTEGNGYQIRATPVDHTIFCLAYALIEDDRPGKFDKGKAENLGVPEGPLFGRLQRGEEIALPGGLVVKPSDVLDPPRRGRKVVYAVDTRPCEEVVGLAQGADVLVHEGVFGEELKKEANLRGHSTVAQAAEVARRAGVGRLILTHISPRYKDVRGLLAEARAAFPRTNIARDLMEWEVPVHK